jgi:hypothetical protein
VFINLRIRYYLDLLKIIWFFALTQNATEDGHNKAPIGNGQIGAELSILHADFSSTGLSPSVEASPFSPGRRPTGGTASND